MKFSAILSASLLLGTSLLAGVPSSLNYQGRIMQNGQPFDGTGHFVFGIYEGSTLLWTNKLPVPSPLNDPATAIDSSDAKALTVRNGVFTVRLGEGDANNAPVGTDVFFKFDGTQRVRTDVKLKVWFSPVAEGPYTNLEPDITFASVPFAHVAAAAASVKEGSVGTSQIADGAVTSAKMSGGNVGSAQLADSAITQEKLADGAVTNAKMGEGSVGIAQLATGVVTTEKLSAGSVTTEKLAVGVAIPPGTVVPFAGANVPIGWALCNGQTLDGSQPQNAGLFAAIGLSYGGTGTNFNVPDLRGRTVIGTGQGDTWTGAGGSTDWLLGVKFGAEKHVMSIGEMPSHNHGVNDPGHSHKATVSNFLGGAFYATNQSSQSANHFPSQAPNTSHNTTGITIQNTGGGQPHNNMQPSLVLNYIIKL